MSKQNSQLKGQSKDNEKIDWGLMMGLFVIVFAIGIMLVVDIVGSDSIMWTQFTLTIVSMFRVPTDNSDLIKMGVAVVLGIVLLAVIGLGYYIYHKQSGRVKQVG